MDVTKHWKMAWGLVSSLRRSKWSQQAISEYQARALIEMMRYAVSHVPYYQRLGMQPGDIRTEDDLAHFPVITKSTIQEFEADLIADDYSRSSLNSSVTSGSSGQPTTTYFDRASWLQCKYVLKIKRMIENNVGIFGRVIIASEYAPDALANGNAAFLPGSGLFFQQRRVSVHESPAAHVDVFKTFKPDALYTFPSYVSELIDYCDAHSIVIPSLRVVFTSSEVLRPQLRKRIESFFGSSVCDIYGSTEFKEVAWQCDSGRYHLNFESVYIEPTNTGIGEHKPLLLSTLLNRAMPLLRFRIGDLGKLNHGLCSCGRESPHIDTISGREVDLLELPSGRKVSPYVLSYKFDETREISKFQFVQTSPDRLEIRVTLRPCGCKVEDLQYIAKEVAARLDREIEVKLVEVDDIPRTKGGKHKVFMRSAMESSI